MNTNILYIGRINRVKSVNHLSVDGIEINSYFVGYALVKQSKYNYKNIITGKKYKEFNIDLREEEEYIDTENLIPFNERYKNKTKFLTRSQILKKINEE